MIFTGRPDGDVETEFSAGIASFTASGRLAERNTRTYSVQLTPGAAVAA